ncbi:MAG TPA: amidohydrolase family protein [Candidatus Acidoferrales bacterium]|nr:amidohydrolase family protein [Candidatus Acidoferrales bacterium]
MSLPGPATRAHETFADVRAAQGLAPVDLLLQNCRLVNVCSREIHPADIAIRGSKVLGIREKFSGPAVRTIDVASDYAVPAFVQLYRGFESSALSGVTTWVVEQEGSCPVSANDEANTHHARRVQAPSFSRHLGNHQVCTAVAEAITAIRGGATVFLAESPQGPSLAALLAEIRGRGIDASRLCICLPEDGAASAFVRAALANSFSAPEIFQLLTLNSARHFALDHEIGSIAPGRKADIILAKSLDPFLPVSIIFDGQLVLHEGHPCA